MFDWMIINNENQDVFDTVAQLNKELASYLQY
jgi:hypothetical protein